MASLLQLLFGDGWGDEVQREGVGEDYGLTGAQIQPLQRSPYERTMAPGETRDAASLRDMLADVIMAAASPAALAGGRATAVGSRPLGARVRRGVDPGQASQVNADRIGARGRAQYDDLSLGYTKPDGTKVVPGPRVVLAKDLPGSHAEKFAGEVTVPDARSGRPVTLNIWRDPDGNHYAAIPSAYTPRGYKDAYKTEGFAHAQELKRAALDAFAGVAGK